MYRFQINAPTQVGESIGIVGSTPELGLWDIVKCVRLRTSSDRYPIWWADVDFSSASLAEPLSNLVSENSASRIRYKYVRLYSNGSVEWEALGSDRWVPLEPNPPATITVDDGLFGQIQPFPYGYFQEPVARPPLAPSPQGLKIVVLGSSVALGCSAWLLKGWAWHLEQKLHEAYGHQLVNVSALGANVSTTIERFAQIVIPQKPDIVILALSLGNEGFAYCPPQHLRAVQRRFENGLQQLVKMIRELGAHPILGSVYPHRDYTPDHYPLLWETHHRMLTWDVPVLDWLGVLDDGHGRWKPGISFDPAHPNSEGHRLMYEAIALDLFQMTKENVAQERQRPCPSETREVYSNDQGFRLLTCTEDKWLRIINPSDCTYTLRSSWEELQIALQRKAKLLSGLYIAKNAQVGTSASFWVQPNGTIETTVDIPPAVDVEYHAAFNFFSPPDSQMLFYDGQLGLLKESDTRLRVFNESEHEYNIHPMWKEIRGLLKAMPPGVYDDPLFPDHPFRTMMIGRNGLESRVKALPRSSVLFQYRCSLSEISRVAILPLGDRCAIRMLLYKMEYDGPAFPFDLTRTTNLADVADMIANGFQDMWNPALLHYNHDAKRIYHSKWSGLSFAHEVEDTDDPVHNMAPVHERMRVRYTARSERFWYTLNKCDKVLFVRTGFANRGMVMDLVSKLEVKCQGKPFRVLLISPQSSEEFSNLPNVLHYNLEFNPDRMYEDLGYWMHCTEIMRGILESLGVSSNNLFWCPPTPPKD